MINFTRNFNKNISKPISNSIVRKKSTHVSHSFFKSDSFDLITEIMNDGKSKSKTNRFIETITKHVIKVIDDKDLNDNSQFINFVREFTEKRFVLLFGIAKDISPDLTTTEFIERSYALTLYSNYQRQIDNTSTYNDPGTILDKDFFSRE